jgi:hypothetical protein
MKKLILIFIIFTYSCKDNIQVDQLKEQNNALREKVNQLEEEKFKPKIKNYSEEKAISMIKDNYAFYKSDLIYRNIKLRRRNPNSFDVSIQEAYNHNNESMDYVWNTENYKLIKTENITTLNNINF